MRNRMKVLPVVLTATLVACGSGSDAGPAQAAAKSAPSAEAIANAVDPVIRRALAEEGIPGAAFVFVHEDQVVYAQGYGMADQARRVAVDV